MGTNNKMTITDAAKIIGVVPKTIVRWEKAGKIKTPKRNWRGWRVYNSTELKQLKSLHDSLY
ncbi:MAG: MerR family transcriptional regulator [Candidatus Omnitrophica bacterium]|nr:MerR family transcriptional regulator [Candidatus Omnitrophota bacterium]